MLGMIALFLDDKTMTKIFLGQFYQMTGYPIFYPSPKGRDATLNMHDFDYNTLLLF